MLRYKGAAHFRQRIVLATLSGRAVRIDDIRSEEEQVGLRDYEACFLRLLEKVVNGCEIVINETGTAMRYRPGIIVGGGGHVHECGTSRAISYFIQPLLALAPFGKQPLSVTLRGVTNATGDVGVDVLRTVTLPMLRHFGFSEGSPWKETMIDLLLLPSARMNSTALYVSAAGRRDRTFRRSNRPCRFVLASLSKYMTWNPSETK